MEDQITLFYNNLSKGNVNKIIDFKRLFINSL
jgi:hypothetical protein